MVVYFQTIVDDGLIFEWLHTIFRCSYGLFSNDLGFWWSFCSNGSIALIHVVTLYFQTISNSFGFISPNVIIVYFQTTLVFGCNFYIWKKNFFKKCGSLKLCLEKPLLGKKNLVEKEYIIQLKQFKLIIIYLQVVL